MIKPTSNRWKSLKVITPHPSPLTPSHPHTLTPSQLEEVDDRLLSKLSYVARGDVAPMQAVIGSIAAQEVVKACSGKFTPLNQWFYFDSLESLEEDFQTFPEEVVTATGSRYDGQVAVFGANLQKVLENWRVFVVRRQ